MGFLGGVNCVIEFVAYFNYHIMILNLTLFVIKCNGSFFLGVRGCHNILKYIKYLGGLKQYGTLLSPFSYDTVFDIGYQILMFG